MHTISPSPIRSRTRTRRTCNRHRLLLPLPLPLIQQHRQRHQRTSRQVKVEMRSSPRTTSSMKCCRVFRSSRCALLRQLLHRSIWILANAESSSGRRRRSKPRSRRSARCPTATARSSQLRRRLRTPPGRRPRGRLLLPLLLLLQLLLRLLRRAKRAQIWRAAALTYNTCHCSLLVCSIQFQFLCSNALTAVQFSSPLFC